MKSYKELLNQVAAESSILRQLTEEESLQLKHLLLQMYKDVYTLCQKNNLMIMLCGGSCLGAIRHKGFIPWDDDLDLMMPREDYEKMKILLEEGALGEEYEFSYPGGKDDSPSAFMKIYKKNTRCIEIGSQYSPYPKGVFLDIFILDGTYRCSWIRKLKGAFVNALRLIANSVASANIPVSDVEKSFFSSNKTAFFQFKTRRYVGKLMSVIPHKLWIKWFDIIVRNPNMTNYVCIPTGRMLYAGECFHSSVYYPPIKAEFEGTEVLIPNGYDDYLTNLYHDYMELPPVEKRERHFIVDFEL